MAGYSSGRGVPWPVAQSPQGMWWQEHWLREPWVRSWVVQTAVSSNWETATAPSADFISAHIQGPGQVILDQFWLKYHSSKNCFSWVRRYSSESDSLLEMWVSDLFISPGNSRGCDRAKGRAPQLTSAITDKIDIGSRELYISEM